MKALVWLSSFALALSLVPSLAKADDPSLTARVEKRVKKGLLEPLAKHESERSRFSRARLPPRERRVRVTQAATSADKAGGAFVPFAIDVRWGGDKWQESDIVGCAYPKTGALFVKRGDDYRPAVFLLGKAADPVAGVCQAAPART